MTAQNVTLRLQVDNREFVGTLKASTEEVRRLGRAGQASGREMREIGTQAGATSIGLKALGAAAASAFAALKSGQIIAGAIREQEQMQRNLLRTEALLKATGSAAGFSARQLQDQARELARGTLQSTEGVQRAQQILLTFRQVSGETFTRATELAADLATVTGSDLNSAMTQLGRALEDPVQGINAMTRSGVSFTAQQKDTIRSLVETNRQAEAQTLILDELARQYGGVARAEAQGLAGAQDTLAQATQEAKIKLAEMLNLGPTFTVILNDMAASVDASGEAFNDYESEVTLFADVTLGVLGTFADGTATIFRTLAATVNTFGQGVGATAAALALAVQGDLGSARAVFKLFAEDAQANFTPVINESSKFRDMIASIRERSERLRQEQAALGGATDRVASSATALGSAAGLTAERIAKMSKEAQKLRDMLYPADTALRELIAGMELLRAAGGNDAEIARFVDQWADQLVGIDAATQAVRKYEQQIALLEVALDEGLLSSDRFEEFAARARASMQDALDAPAEVAEKVTEPFQDLRDVIVAMGADWAQAAAAMVQGLENISKGSQTAVRGYAQLTQGAAGFFKQGTGGYKLLQAASQAFYAFEIANQAASVIASIAANKTKQGEAIITAQVEGSANVASSGVGLPFPANIAAMAATIAFLASLGIRTGGGGGAGGALDAPRGGDPIRTSGTVLGRPEEDSKSIASGIQMLVGIEREGLRIAREQLDALRSIERASAGITSEFARGARARGVQQLAIGGSAGAVTADFGTELHPLIRQLLRVDTWEQAFAGAAGGTRDLTQNTFARAMQSIFDDIGTALMSAVTAFGGDADEARRIFEQLPLADILIRESEDIDAAIQALVGAVGDSAIAAASQLLNIPLAQFQRFGEGALETLVRLTAQLGILRDGAGALGITIQNIFTGASGRQKFVPASTEHLIAIADDLAQRAGGVEAFATRMAAFLDLTLSQTEKLTRQGDLLREALAGVGVVMPDSTDGLRDIARGLNLTTEAGRAAFSTLLELAPALGDYFDALAERERTIADERLGLLERLADATGDAALADQVRNDLLARQRAALDASNQALFDQVVAAEAAAAVERRLADERRRIASLEIRLATASGNVDLATALRRSQEMAAAASAAELALLQLIYAAEDAAAASAAAAQRAAEAERARAEAIAVAQRAVDEARRALLAAYDREIDALREVVAAAEQAASRLREAQDALRAAYSAEAQVLQARVERFTRLGDAIREFVAGINADVLGVQDAQARFRSIAQRARLGDEAALAALPQAGRAAVDQARQTARTREEWLTAVAQIRHDALLASETADNQAGVAQQQLDALTAQVTALGVLNNSVLSVREAIENLLQADAAHAIAAQDAALAQSQIDRLREARDAVDGVNGATLSVQQAIDALDAAQRRLIAATNTGVDYVGQQTRATAQNTAAAASLNAQQLAAVAASLDALTLLPTNLGGISAQQAQAIISAIAVGYTYDAANGTLIHALTGEVIQLRQLAASSEYVFDRNTRAIAATMRDVENAVFAAVNHGGVNVGQWAAFTYYSLEYWQPRIVSMLDWGFNAVVSAVRKSAGSSSSSSVQQSSAFALGGAFSGGRVVDVPTTFDIGLMGERGPEAILPLTRLPGGALGVQAQAGSGLDAAVLAELRALREEVARLRDESARGQFAIAANTGRMVRQQAKWDKDGLPQERAA